MPRVVTERLAGVVSGGAYERASLARFETFLFGAVGTVLVTRAFLAVTGYPQVGGGNLHVAHVLWGGLLMGAAVVALVIVPGSAVTRRAALVGGVGFGLFIDEVGKFLTKDVDYFFQPAIAVMYVVFVCFYLVVRVVLRRRRLTDRLRLATGLDALSDQARGQLRQPQRDLALALLDEITEPHVRAVAAEVRTALASDAVADTGFEHRLTVWRDNLSRRVDDVLARDITRRIMLGFLVLQAVLSLADLGYLFVARDAATRDQTAWSAATIAGGTVTVMVVVGSGLLLRHRYLAALHILHAAIVVNLLVSQVFLFASEQFGALAGFAVSLVMLGVLRNALRHEELARAPAD